AGLRTLRSLGTLASVEGWASGVRLIARGIESVARAAFGQAGVAPAGHLVRAIFLAVFALAMWRFLGRERRPTPGEAWGTSMLLFALAIPYLLPWYTAWFVLLLPILSDDLLIWTRLASAL